MTVGSGIGSALGLAPESTFGTFVTPTNRWIEFESEQVKFNPKRLNAGGLAAGNAVHRSSQRVTTTSTVQGTIKTPIYTKGMGLLLANGMGTQGSAPVQQASTTAYLQTHAYTAAQAGQSISAQVLRPDATGTQHAYSYAGGKVIQTVLECGIDEVVMGTFDVDFQSVSEVPSAGTPSFQTPNPVFHFAQGAIVAGTYGSETATAQVRKFTLTAKRPVQDDRYYLGSAGLKAEPITNDLADLKLALDTDFVDKTVFADKFVSDTPISVILTFIGGQISGIYNYQLQLIFPACRFDTDPPVVDSAKVLSPSFDLVPMFDDTHPACTITYQSTDTTL